MNGTSPRNLRFGVVLFAIAAAGDTVTHVVDEVAGLQHAAHVLTLLSMVVVLAVVVSTGLQRSRQHDTRR